MYFIVVRKGDFRRQDALHKAFGSLTPVIWDRRARQRREENAEISGPERRQSDRRKGPTPSWEALGFVVIKRGD